MSVSDRMRPLRPWLLTLLVGTGALVTALFLHLRTARGPLDGRVAAPRLRDSVTVRVDSFAVPQVYGGSERDVFFAQGWLHASERLWQMEVFRRTAQGRLAELFGPEALPADRLLRTLDLWGAARRAVAALGREERRLLSAYAAGVNARLSRREGALPPELELLRETPRPWTARASAAVSKVMALDLSPFRLELSRFWAWRQLPEEKFELVRARYPAWGPTVLGRGGAAGEGAAAVEVVGPRASPALSEVVGERPAGGRPAVGERRAVAGRGGPVGRAEGRCRGPAEGSAGGGDPLAFLSRPGPAASNVWALSGARTASGAPLLASDMHLGLRAPAVWYVMGLHAGESDLSVAGLTLPGTPGVVVGYNRGVAWGVTASLVDDMDFAVETVDLDGARYRTEEGWRAFVVRPETIRVRGREEPVVHRVRETVRGPVISDALPSVGATLSAAWTARLPSAPLEGLLAMNRSETARGFRRAVRRFDGPSLNVVFASRGDTLGYQLSGRVPVRRGFSGRLPVGARSFGTGWAGTWPPDSLPGGLFSGATGGPDGAFAGFLASANNLPAPGSFGRLGVDYPTPFRARRLVDVLSRARDWDPVRMAALQRDTRSLLADRLGHRAAAAARRAGADSAAAVLEAWDHDVDRGSRAAGLFYAWVYGLRSRIAGDEYRTAGRWQTFPVGALVRLLEEGEGRAWVDDVRTLETESLAELEEEAVREAVEVTRSRPWGELHSERSAHVLGRVRWLERLLELDVGPYPAPGAPATVRASRIRAWSRTDSGAWRPPWESRYGPTERFVAQMGADGARGWILLPTGQSGVPFSRHYRDMSERWRGGGSLIPLPLEREAVERRSVRTLRLVPATGDETPLR